MSLSTRLGGLRLPSPVLVAAGCAGTGRELHRYVDLAQVALVTTPSLRLEPVLGRTLPDLTPTPSGLLLATDRSRPGIREFVRQDLPWLASVGARVCLSIGGGVTTEFAEALAVATESPAFSAVAAVELELAAPRRAAQGRPFTEDVDACARVVHGVREVLPEGVLLLAKLSSDGVDVVETARAVLLTGADGVVLLAPPAGLAVDTRSLRLATGELASFVGPAIRPLVASAVARVRRAMQAGVLPERAVVACGGVDSGESALEMLAVGADAVQLGSVLLTDPFAVSRVERELEGLLDALPDASAPADVVGRALPVRTRSMTLPPLPEEPA